MFQIARGRFRIQFDHRSTQRSMDSCQSCALENLGKWKLHRARPNGKSFLMRPIPIPFLVIFSGYHSCGVCDTAGWFFSKSHLRGQFEILQRRIQISVDCVFIVGRFICARWTIAGDTWFERWTHVLTSRMDSTKNRKCHKKSSTTLNEVIKWKLFLNFLVCTRAIAFHRYLLEKL